MRWKFIISKFFANSPETTTCTFSESYSSKLCCLLKDINRGCPLQEFRGAIVIKFASASPLLIWQIPFHFLIRPVEKKLPVTGVSAVGVFSFFRLESFDSNLWSFVIMWSYSNPQHTRNIMSNQNLSG